MRVTRRTDSPDVYWTRRWQGLHADEPMSNEDNYPLKHVLAAMRVAPFEFPILEAGCGTGRLMRYLHQTGREVVGFDFVQEAVDSISTADSSINVTRQDVRELDYADNSFGLVTAFGLFHSLPEGAARGLEEIRRVLVPGVGVMVMSFRADNLQNWLIDVLWTMKSFKRGVRRSDLRFHKQNLRKKELVQIVESSGFLVERVEPEQNMPFLYKFRFFRSRPQKNFDESVARSEGYKLSSFGKSLQGFLVALFPYQFCNVLVVYARKPE